MNSKFFIFFVVFTINGYIYGQESSSFKCIYNSFSGNIVSVKIIELYTKVISRNDSLLSVSIAPGNDKIVTFRTDSLLTEFSPGDTCFGTYMSSQNVWFLKKLYKKEDAKLFFDELKISIQKVEESESLFYQNK